MIGWLVRRFRANPRYPEDALWNVKEARVAGKDAVFHGACLGCIWQKGNAQGEGLRWCSGCRMFSNCNFSNKWLPDRRQTMPDKEPEWMWYA